MFIDNDAKTTTGDFPYSNLSAYHAALYDPRYTLTGDEGKVYRASVNAKLEASPCIMPGPNDEKIRQDWLRRDA